MPESLPTLHELDATSLPKYEYKTEDIEVSPGWDGFQSTMEALQAEGWGLLHVASFAVNPYQQLPIKLFLRRAVE